MRNMNSTRERPIYFLLLLQKHRIFSMDSNLEAFSYYPTHGSFAALAVQLTALPIM